MLQIIEWNGTPFIPPSLNSCRCTFYVPCYALTLVYHTRTNFNKTIEFVANSSQLSWCHHFQFVHIGGFPTESLDSKKSNSMKVLNIANNFDFLLDWIGTWKSCFDSAQMISYKPSRIIEEFHCMNEICSLVNWIGSSRPHPSNLKSPYVFWFSVNIRQGML